MKTIAVLGTFDTKGLEHTFVAECIRESGFEVMMIDVSTSTAPRLAPSFGNDATNVELPPLAPSSGRGAAVKRMCSR
jgi:uncharacterized protein (UPF0261 family)